MTVSHWQRGEKEPPVEADVIVVGAGIAGASAAWWLGRGGRRVAVVDRGAGPAEGASGRNAGFLTCGSVGHFAHKLREVGRDKALALRELTRESLELVKRNVIDDRLSCDYRRRGSFSLAADEAELAELEAAARVLAKARFEVEVVGAGEVERRLGARGFCGAVLSGEDAEVDPVLLVRGILERSGARFYPGHEVYRIEEQGGAVTVLSGGRRFEGAQVVLATGGDVARLAPALAPHVRPARAQMIATAPAPPRLESPCYVRSVFAYVRQLQDGRVLAGGFRHLAGKEAVEDRVDPAVDRALADFLRDRFPPLSGAAIESRWTGLLGLSADGLPIVGLAPGQSRVFVAAGFSGHGVGWGFKVGELIARRLLSGDEPPHLGAARL